MLQEILKKEKEAEAYQDQSSYNAAYCYGYVAGAKWVCEHLFAAFLDRLPDVETATADQLFCQNGEEILSRNEAALNHLADAFEESGQTDVVTGYYDPAEDEESGNVDGLTGYHYLTL